MNFIRFKKAIEDIKKFIKDCLKQAIENKEDFLNQIKGDTVLSWCNRIIIAGVFFLISLLFALLLFLIQDKEYAVLIAVAFTFINGIGIFIIRTADRKKEFNDKKQEFDDRKLDIKEALFSQRNSRLLDAIKLISQESAKVKEGEKSEKFNQAVIRFAFSELIELRQSSDFKKRIDLFTSHNRFMGFNLSGLDLSHFDFNGTKLQGAQLIKAKLKNAKMQGTDLGSIISGYLKLKGANLKDADLKGADLTDAILSHANLSYAKLNGAKLNNAKLKKASLIDAKLIKAEMVEANLSNTDLRGADFSSAILRNADLSNADVDGTNFKGADLSRIKKDGTDFSGAILDFPIR